MADRQTNLKEGVLADITVSANAANQAFEVSFTGSYLYQIEMLSSIDTTVQLTILSHLGTTLYDSTSADWTLATGNGGVPQFPSDSYAITGNLKYTVAGLGSGTFRFILFGARSPAGD
jgi:hypothetical protein